MGTETMDLCGLISRGNRIVSNNAASAQMQIGENTAYREALHLLGLGIAHGFRQHITVTGGGAAGKFRSS